MFKIKFTKSICILSVLFLFSSCVSNNFAVRGKSPSWVTDTEYEYSKNNLCAVGIASSQEEANSMAISNIGKIIKQKIESEITVVNSESMSSKGNSELTSSINQIVKTSALIDSLVGVEIAETWKDKDGNFYSLAILNKTKTYLYYSEKISENEKTIKENINLISTDKDKFFIYGKLQNAIKLAQDNETYLDIIYAVNKASYTVTAKTITKVNYIENLASDFARKIYITISGLENKERIKNYFYKYFTDKGFSVNAPQTNYYFNIDLNIENTTSGELFYARYNFSANLDSKNGLNIIELMQELNRTHNTTFIFSTHDKMVMEHCRRIIKIKDGKFID